MILSCALSIKIYLQILEQKNEKKFTSSTHLLRFKQVKYKPLGEDFSTELKHFLSNEINEK